MIHKTQYISFIYQLVHLQYRRSISRNALNNNDPRSVQHRLATSRIQQEINEATEREKELRAAGMIQTTSEDTVDSKVGAWVI